MNSFVWQYFEKTKDKDKAQCLKCPKILSCKGSSTSSLLNHLKVVHKIISEQEDRPSTSHNTAISNSIKKFTNTKTLSCVLAQCVAEDGFSVNSLYKSKMAKAYLKSIHLERPLSRATVWKFIYDFYLEKQQEYTKLFEKMVQSKIKFSLVVDEWSDVSNKKYLNVSIRCINESRVLEVYNLGLEHIILRGSAENLEYYVKKKLMEFNLDISKDVVASTHDGAAVMKKYGSSIPAIGQLCYNHAIHLAVPKRSKEKQDKLQHYVKKELGQELILQIDVKHRWNSLSVMISTFLKIKSCINHALLDLRLETFSENELLLLENISISLLPLEIAVKKLSCDTATLIDAEGILKFLLKSLTKQSNTISQKLLSSLLKRIEERRNIVLNTLILYLHSATYPTSSEHIKYSPKYLVIEMAEELYNRLFVDHENSDTSDSLESDLEYFENESQNLEEQLNNTLKEVQNPPKRKKTLNNGDLKEDFDYLDKFSKRTNKLELLYYALLTINPTSTVSERVFSVSSIIKTKLRNRMSSTHLNCILFLKYYFKRTN